MSLAILYVSGRMYQLRSKSVFLIPGAMLLLNAPDLTTRLTI